MNEMNLGLSERAAELRDQVSQMILEEIMPLDEEFLDEVGRSDRWKFTDRQTEILESLKTLAKSRGLWNFWLTSERGGPGLTTVEYAYLAEEMGKSHLAPEVFNCNAPDTGNMEVLIRCGTDEIRERWLKPLLNGEIRSAYLMTEPEVASSDATNISMACIRDGDSYVLNGEKWWATGAGDPRCALYIVMVRTSVGDKRHRNHSMLVVPSSTKGIKVLRPMTVYGQDDAPHGHRHIRFTDVMVPGDNLLLELVP